MTTTHHRPHGSPFGRISFSRDTGSKAWRRAVRNFDDAMSKILSSDPMFDPSGKVVCLAAARRSTGGFEGERRRRVEAFREVATTLLRIEPPNPREVANKLLLIAWLEGMEDPRLSYGEGDRLEVQFARLFVQLHCLDQFHDPDHFKRRRGKKG